MARETHDLGPLYVHTMRVPRGGPVLELGTSHEVEEPWRVGRCVVLRLWKLALVAGWWGPGRTEAEVWEAEASHNGIVTSPPNAAGITLDTIREDFRPQPVETAVDDWRVV